MKILSYPELRSEKGVRFSRQWIAKLVKDGKFPPPVHLGGATTGFIESEVDAWLKARVAERDGEVAA